MSVEHYNEIGIGFPISEEMIPKKFKKVKPEKSHFEDRWDPKTGEKLPKEKIIDEEEEEVFVLGKEEYEDFYEFGHGLARHLGCTCSQYGDLTMSNNFYTIELKSVRPDGKESGPDGLEVRALIKLLPKYYAVRNKLRKMGIKVQNEPVIQLQETVS